MSHRFSVVVFSLSFVSSHIFISFLISSVICWLFTSILVSLPVFVFRIYFFLALLCGLLIEVASAVAEHRLQVHGLLQQLQYMGSVVVAHELSCPVACGVFLV